MSFRSIVSRLTLLLVFLAGLAFQPQSVVLAAANLTITPLTWNVVGLDSNNVSVGPNNFPVGARVCNSGDATATNVSSTFNWEATDPTPAKDYINLRPGSNTSYSGYSLAPNACVDFYYEVQVTRDANAYNDTRRYYITATADALGTISTPRPREIFVEHLISQNRNAVTDVKLDGASTPAGGTMTLMVGNTYNIQLVGNTATQGYEQLESFINFPNTIFQVNSVTSTYSANAGTDPLATTRPYADGCTWVNDPNSPNYRSCVATGKYGGSITVTYNVTILSGAGTTQSLNTLIYDFSGSSYHYNADFSTGVRYVSILGPSSIQITKTFAPKAISPGGTSVLTFKLTNPTTETISGVNFTDTLLGGLKVASTPNVGYSGCGSGAFSPVPVANATSLSFSNGTIAPNGTCTINVSVTADAAADYPNTTSNLFINTSTDTGNFASDTLKVSSASACVPGQTLATWTFPSGSSATTPAYTTKAGNVATATASTTTTASTIDTNIGNPAPSWSGRNFPSSGAVTGDTSPYFQFAIDTSKYSGVQVSLSFARDSNWGGGSSTTPTIYVWSSTTGGAGSFSQIFSSTTFDTTFRSTGNLNAAATGSSQTYFRINAVGATNSNAFMQIDTVTFTGCLIPAPAPTLAKSFSPDPIVKGANTTLTFTITNTASGNVAQSGISFTDVLPDGLVIATPNGVGGTCTGGTVTAVPGTDTISLSGQSLAAGGSCTITVNVTGVEEGNYENITGFLSSTESGTSTSYATDTLTVIAPPTLEKSFSPSSILVGETSTLQFLITNPNQTTTLTGIGFTDTLPAGVTAADDSGSVCNGTWNIVSNVLTFSGGSVNANSSCTFSITVTGVAIDPPDNVTTAVTSVEGGSGNTATATLAVSNPQPLIGLLKQISTDNATWVKYVGLIPTADIYYRFTITNDGETTLNNISVADPDVNMAACSPTLPTLLAVGDSASCVVGPISISSAPSPNPFVNTATATTSTYTGGDEGTSSAQYGTISLLLDKTADKSVFFAAGETITYDYLVTNNGGYPLLGPVTVADDKATVTCPDVNTVGDNDDYLDPGESVTCTATYLVTAGDVTAGRVTNTATATVDGVDSNTDGVTVTLPPDLAVTKTNNVSGSLALGNSFDWTITVTNNGVADASFADANSILMDTLPGAAGYYPQGALTVIPGATSPSGTIDCSITGTALGCAANGPVSLAEGASFSVTFTVTPSAAGSLVNTATVDPGSAVTELDETNNSSADTVTVIAPPSIEKQFIPEIIAVGDTSALTFTISNTNAGTDLTGVAFTDSLPVGLQVANPPNVSVSGCGSPVFSPSAGDTTLTFGSGTITASGSCSISVDVVATTSGRKNNTTGNVSSTNGGTGGTASYVLNVFDAQPSKSLVATSESFTGFSPGTDRVAIGEMIRYRLAAMIPEGSFTNVQLLDGIPTGLQFLDDGTATTAFVCNGGASCMTSSTLNGAGLVVNGSSSSISPTFVLPGSAIGPGAFGSGTDVTFSLGNITNSDSDADSEYIVIEFNALVLNVNATATINQGTNNQTGANVANNRQNDVTLLVNGGTVGSASPNVTVSIAEPAITGITKSVAPATGPYLPGDSLTYTLSFSNVSASNTNAATAFDIVLTDTFDSSLTLGAVNVSSDQGATCAGGNTFSTSNSTVVQLITVNVSCLDPGNTVTVTVDATISNSAPSGTTISNSASLTYTGLPGEQGNCAAAPFTCTLVGSSGSTTGERNGSGGSGADSTVLNNYAATSNTVNVTPAYGSITISKDALPDDPQDFSFTGSGPNGFDFGGGFSLDDDADGTLPSTATFNTLVPGTYSATEGAQTGWSLTGLTCVDPDNGSSTDLGTSTATVDLDADENITCTFTNTQLVASIVLTKTPTLDDTVVPPNGVVNAGDMITYTFSVENTGNVTISNITVTDPLLPTLSCTIASLAPGVTDSCAATNNVYTLSQADIDSGSRDNTATATGADPGNNPVTDDDTQTVNLSSSPSIVLTKTPTLDDTVVAPGGVVNAGDTITYAFSVENTGNVTITDIVVTDPLLPALSCTIPSLAPAATDSCTATNNVYTLTQADIDNGSRLNTATATGDDPDSNPVTDADTQIVALVQSPAIALVKTGTLNDDDGTPGISAGDTISYVFTVMNTGNVTLTNITLADTVGGVTITGGPIASLTPGASDSTTFTGTYTVTVVDINAGTFTNTATVTGTPPTGSDVTDADDDTQSLTVNASIVLTKTPTLDDTVVAPGGVVNVGDTITYGFSVENTGNVNITNIVVTDPLLPTLSCTIASLAPGVTSSCAAANNVYILTQADIDNGSRANTATATGTDPGNNPVTDSDIRNTSLTQSPSVVLIKTATLDDAVVPPGGVVNAGDTITYAFTVENTGNVTVTNIVVADPLLPTLSCTIASLAPGVTDSCAATNNVYTLTQADIDSGSRANTATATGDYPGSNPVTDTDTQTTSLSQAPSLNIVKEVSTDNSTWNDTSVTVAIGDTVYYRIRVANTGNITLTGLTVDDGMAGCTLVRGTDLTGDNDADFEAGEEWVYTCSIIAISGTNDNTATADTNETPQDGDTASYTASASLVADPAISKAGDPLQASVGETVTFTLTVTNQGNAPASGVVVTDTLPPQFDVTAVNVTDAPFGTSVNVTPPIGTGPAPYTVVVTLGGDLGVTDVVTIEIVTTVNSLGNPPITNTASLVTSSTSDVVSNNAASVTITTQTGRVTRLPATGFAPNVETRLPEQPRDLVYASTDLLLEIPALGIKIPIVGVPAKQGGWDVSWLGKQAGWLEGSAFPSWNGNSVLTSHVYDSNGLPGPFVNLNKLKYGDKVIVHAYGQKFTFEVRANTVVESNDSSVLRHEERPWLTLVTCKEYDEKSNTYRKRVVIRAVLVDVSWE